MMTTYLQLEYNCISQNSDSNRLAPTLWSIFCFIDESTPFLVPILTKRLWTVKQKTSNEWLLTIAVSPNQSLKAFLLKSFLLIALFQHWPTHSKNNNYGSSQTQLARNYSFQSSLTGMDKDLFVPTPLFMLLRQVAMLSTFQLTLPTLTVRRSTTGLLPMQWPKCKPWDGSDGMQRRNNSSLRMRLNLCTFIQSLDLEWCIVPPSTSFQTAVVIEDHSSIVQHSCPTCYHSTGPPFCHTQLSPTVHPALSYAHYGWSHHGINSQHSSFCPGMLLCSLTHYNEKVRGSISFSNPQYCPCIYLKCFNPCLVELGSFWCSIVNDAIVGKH